MRIRVEAKRPDPRKLEPALLALRKGEVIIYPTDTGYAFGCSMSSAKGIQSLRKLKGIGEKSPKPLTMLVDGMHDLGRYGHLSNQAFRTIRRLLPGPYTMVLPATADVPRAMKNRAHEVGIRYPEHATCNMLVQDLGEPLLTGSISPAEEMPELEEPEMFEGRYPQVSVVVDAGPIWPEPSTVLKLEDDRIEVLREGQGAVPE